MVLAKPPSTTGRPNTPGMEANEVKRMKDLEEENNKRKRIVANLTLEIDAVKLCPLLINVAPVRHNVFHDQR